MKNLKTIIAITLVCIMVLGIYIGTKPVTNEPDANGIGWGGLKDETEEEFMARSLKNQQDKYNQKYGISEEKRQEYRDAQIYPDVLPGMWYTEAINAMTDGGLLNGYTDGLFHPDDYVTQGQLAKVLCEYYDLEPIAHTVASGYCSACHIYHENTPVTTHWALSYAWDARLAGRYRAPAICGKTLDNPVWRGDILSVIASSVAYPIPKYFDENHNQVYFTEKNWTNDNIPDYDDFKDGYTSDEIEQGHFIDARNIVTAYNLGITKGIDDSGTCSPRKPMTRAELCQMLYNLGVTRKGQADGYYKRSNVSPNL